MMAPLYTETGVLTAFAIPFKDGNQNWKGLIVVGANMASLNFYLIDKTPVNYNNIVQWTSSGYKVIFVKPYYYVINNDNPSLAGLNQQYNKDNGSAASSNEYNRGGNTGISSENMSPEEYAAAEKNRQSNLAVLNSLETDSGNATEKSVQTTSANIDIRLQSEYDTPVQYVKIWNGTSGTNAYGGKQRWWLDYQNNYTPRLVYAYGSGSYMNSHGCGAVAIANVLAYYLRKDYSTYNKLLKYTDELRYTTYPSPYGNVNVPNPNYNFSNFTKTFGYSPTINTFTEFEFLRFMDFYTEMADQSLFPGMLFGDLKDGFNEIASITPYSVAFDVPKYKSRITLENFLMDKLSADIPVFMYNELEAIWGLFWGGVNVHYNRINKDEQSFDNHWMTITKYFKNVTSGESFIAFSSWGARYSVNTDLLMYGSGTNGYYYPDFITAELYPDT